MKSPILILLAFIFCSCSNIVPVYYDKKIAPVVDIRKYKTISVDTLTGDINNQFANSLNTNLLKSKNIKVLSRSNLAPVIRENILSSSSKMDKLKTSDIIISGNVGEDFYTETQPLKDQNGSYAGTKYYQTAIVKANLQLIDSKTSEIIWTGEVKGRDYRIFSKYPNDDIVPSSTGASLITEAKNNAVKEFMSIIQPTTVSVAINLFKDDSVKEINDGHELVSDKKFAEAMAKYDEALKNPKITKEGIGSILFAKAVISMINGKYNEAIELSKKAQIENPKNEYSPEIQKIISTKNEYDNLKSLKYL